MQIGISVDHIVHKYTALREIRDGRLRRNSYNLRKRSDEWIYFDRNGSGSGFSSEKRAGEDVCLNLQ